MAKKIFLNHNVYPSTTDCEMRKQSSVILNALYARVRDRLFLTSGGRESHFQVIYATYKDFIRETGRTHLHALEMEVNSITAQIKELEKFDVCGKFLPVNAQGQLTKEILAEGLNPRSAMLSISWANGLTGIIHPLEDIVEICRQKQVRLHVDISHVIGKLYLHLQSYDVDFFTFDARFFHGPASVGGIITKESFTPCFESEDRDFTVLNNAFHRALDQIDHVCTEIARLRDKFEQGMKEAAVECTIFFQEVHRLPHISVMAFPGANAEALLYLCARQGIYVGNGGGNDPKLATVLSQMGIESALAHSALSFALSAETTEEEIDLAIEIVTDNVKKLQSYSKELIS